jgi:hypothetical protein
MMQGRRLQSFDNSPEIAVHAPSAHSNSRGRFTVPRKPRDVKLSRGIDQRNELHIQSFRTRAKQNHESIQEEWEWDSSNLSESPILDDNLITPIDSSFSASHSRFSVFGVYRRILMRLSIAGGNGVPPRPPYFCLTAHLSILLHTIYYFSPLFRIFWL